MTYLFNGQSEFSVGVCSVAQGVCRLILARCDKQYESPLTTKILMLCSCSTAYHSLQTHKRFPAFKDVKGVANHLLGYNQRANCLVEGEIH